MRCSEWIIKRDDHITSSLSNLHCLNERKNFSLGVYKTQFKSTLTASAKIIVNSHIGAVVKVKLRRKTMQPLLAMCEVSHVVGNRHLIILEKNRCWGCLSFHGGWACIQLPFCFILFVSWSGFMAMKEGTECFRHLLRLVEGRSIVIPFDWIVRFVASDWFNVPRFAVFVRKDGH